MGKCIDPWSNKIGMIGMCTVQCLFLAQIGLYLDKVVIFVRQCFSSKRKKQHVINTLPKKNIKLCWFVGHDCFSSLFLHEIFMFAGHFLLLVNL